MTQTPDELYVARLEAMIVRAIDETRRNDPAANYRALRVLRTEWNEAGRPSDGHAAGLGSAPIAPCLTHDLRHPGHHEGGRDGADRAADDDRDGHATNMPRSS